LKLSGQYDAFIITGQDNENAGKRGGILMSLCFSGLDTLCSAHTVAIDASPTPPLIPLAQVIS
jgi:hypothetical protein